MKEIEDQPEPVQEPEIGERGKELGFCCERQCIDCSRWCQE